MTKIKNLIYTPNAANQGKEFIFDDIFSEEAQITIDYSNYSTLSFNNYCNEINQRYSVCLNKNNSKNFLQNNCFDNNFQELKSIIIQLYNDQQNRGIDNYFYIPIQSVINVLQGKTSSSLIKSDINFIFDFNKTIMSNDQGDTWYSVVAESLNDGTPNPDYHTGVSYIGVTKLPEDYNKSIEETNFNYTFKYFEFNFKQEEIHKLISKIEVYGPIGTCFILNHQPHLIYITQSALPEQKVGVETVVDIVHGLYRLDTKGQVLINSITFPKESVPSNSTDRQIKILLYYED